MSDETFDLFCAKCNILVQAKVIAEGSGGYESDAAHPMDEVDAPYHQEYYSVCLCPRCNSPFLIQQDIFGIAGEFAKVADEKVFYPSESNFSIEHLPEKIQSSYEQAVRSFKAVLYEPCVIMCRKCLEITCKSFGIGERSIYGGLQKLHKEGHIDSRLLGLAHEIRLIGNEAVHGSDDNITKEDARDVLDFTEAILISVFTR